jgi:hypothetical protein
MRPAIVALFLGLTPALPVAAQREDCLPVEKCPKDECCLLEAPAPEICPRFCGPLSFQSSQSSAPARVVVRQWQIANQQTEVIPHQGFLIVHVCAGQVTAEVGGQFEEWSEGSFWSVQAGQRLIISTARDSVVLQTVDFIMQ